MTFVKMLCFTARYCDGVTQGEQETIVFERGDS